MLAGLGHGAVSRRYNQDSTVHLRSAGDHVLNIVGVAGAVNVSIVTLVGLILNVSGVDRDSACLLFGGLIDLVVTHSFRVAQLGQNHRDSSGRGRLAVVNVTDSTNVYVRLIALKLCLRHGCFLLNMSPYGG